MWIILSKLGSDMFSEISVLLYAGSIGRRGRQNLTPTWKIVTLVVNPSKSAAEVVILCLKVGFRHQKFHKLNPDVHLNIIKTNFFNYIYVYDNKRLFQWYLMSYIIVLHITITMWMMSRAHSFPLATEFRAEPHNSSYFAELPYFCEILWNCLFSCHLS